MITNNSCQLLKVCARHCGERYIMGVLPMSAVSPYRAHFAGAEPEAQAG